MTSPIAALLGVDLSGAEGKALTHILCGPGDRLEVRVHAHFPTDNHLHLLVGTPKANLSRAMHWFKSATASRSTGGTIGRDTVAGQVGAVSLQSGATFRANP